MASTESVEPAVPDGLPDEEFILERLQLEDSKATAFRSYYPTICLLTLGAMTRATGVPMPADSFYGERLEVRGRVPWCVPLNHPVTAITKVVGPTNQALRVGTELQLAMGQADVAIGDRGDVIRYGGTIWPPYVLFVDYQAGFDVLPNDLLEVFVELALLVGAEKDRVGKTEVKMRDAQVILTRDLPPWCKRILDGYRRVQLYV